MLVLRALCAVLGTPLPAPFNPLAVHGTPNDVIPNAGKIFDPSAPDHHLGVLLKAGVVEQHKDGLKMMYSLKTPCILNFMKCVEGVLREQAKDAAALLSTL